MLAVVWGLLITNTGFLEIWWRSVEMEMEKLRKARGIGEKKREEGKGALNGVGRGKVG